MRLFLVTFKHCMLIFIFLSSWILADMDSIIKVLSLLKSFFSWRKEWLSWKFPYQHLSKTTYKKIGFGWWMRRLLLKKIHWNLKKVWKIHKKKAARFAHFPMLSNETFWRLKIIISKRRRWLWRRWDKRSMKKKKINIWVDVVVMMIIFWNNYSV